MTDNPLHTLPIDSASRLSSLSYYDLDKIPPPTRMWIEANWVRNDIYQCWENPERKAA